MYDKHKAYAQIHPEARSILVWLEHMYDKGRSVLTSLVAQSYGNKTEFRKYKDAVDTVANDYSNWPQCAKYLSEVDEKLMEVGK